MQSSQRCPDPRACSDSQRMKYPQLVSTRAVNAISDWLVSRLEQLGVEAPLIYSRLLLSLLHSSVQINDPIEFSNLESYLANRKGSKRIPRCDSDTLKKVAAVQCLMDTVSSEQEISKIENLVDELCDKLSDIEKQANEEELPKETPTAKTIETEDPRKRYYQAFPALSKEMEDTVWAPKRNTKALTWPTGNSDTAQSYQSALNNTAGVKRKQKRRRNQGISRGKTSNVRKNSSAGNISPTWDTDFEGSWEMGRDLIKEFIVMQNSRNRSTSESDACNIRRNEANHEKRMKPTFGGDEEEFYGKFQQTKKNPQNELSLAISCDDISAISDIHSGEIVTHIVVSDEGYSTNEGLTSLSETDGTSSSSTRRLYERDTSTDSLNMQTEFAQLKAKFNSSVEALWKDSATDTATSSLPPNQQNLENFWTNYYSHCFDIDKFEQNPANSSNDFFSMPSNLGKADSSINSGVRNLLGESSVVFLKDSIWSDYSTKASGGEDADFYANVIGSVLNNDTMNEKSFYDKDSSHPFNVAAKWSECPFETPFVPSSSTSSNETSSMGLSKNDLRENMLKNSYLYNYRQPVAPASNILKNVNVPSAPSSLSDTQGSMNKGEKNTDKQSMSSQSSVTLINHSSNSKFVEYSRVKSVYKFEASYKVDSRDDYRNNQSALPAVSGAEDENLLTSERTHFCPIKQSYADGHQFDISSSLDDIKFERSESGYLCYESEKYLEYTRLDTFLSDDDYVYSFCADGSSGKKPKDEFALKFRVKQVQKVCQTDLSYNEGVVIQAQGRNINIGNRSRRVGDSVDVGGVDDESSDSEATTGEGNLQDEDKANIQQWSMAEIEKRCVENNNTHTLWGMCAACNNETKSLPANRLLKDELNIEADEIMSDLKYMQDLYIGSDWEDDDTDCDADTIRDCELYQSLELAKRDDEQEHILYSVTKFISDLLKPENAKSLANALGANQSLIRTNTSQEDCKPSTKDDEEGFLNNNNSTKNNNEYLGGLWSNDENIIWKRELKPINDNLLSRFNNNIKSSTFLDKLNWEYSNLEEIWKRASQTDGDSDPESPTTQIKAKHIDHKNRRSEITERNIRNVISSNISQQQNYKSFENDHNYVHNFGGSKVVNRSDRKRRHSASQNVNISGSNDFCDNVIIGNKVEVMATQELDYGKLSSMNDSPATIITCKYWTTLDTTTATQFFTDKGSHYDGIPTLAMNPSSILKHVTVVSRPLTR